MSTSRRTSSRNRSVTRLVIAVFVLALGTSWIYSTSSKSKKGSIQKNNGGQPLSKIRSLVTTNPLMPFMPQAQPPSIATYAVDNDGLCTNNPKTEFTLGEKVCAKTTDVTANSPANFSITWHNPASYVVQRTDLTTSTDDTTLLPTDETTAFGEQVVDNRGRWKVEIVPFGRSLLRAVAYFNVSGPTPTHDLNVYDDAQTAADGTVPADSDITYQTLVTNVGPDDATAVTLTQDVPANATFQQQTGGPTCVNPAQGETGQSICAIASISPGTTLEFTFVFHINSGAPKGTVIASKAEATTVEGELYTFDNKWTGKATVTDNPNAPVCAVACPANMTVSANATNGNNERGAVVNFSGSIDFSGDCGTITSDPASGTFFTVSGSPHVVNVSSQNGGGSCSFTITVTETAPPTITCAADQTAQASGSSNEASVTVNTPSTSGGNNVQVTGTRSDERALDDPYPVGTTVITWTAEECNNPPDCNDPAQREASCTQRIIVTSSSAPTISCPSNRSFTGDCSGKTLTAADIGSPTTTGSNVTVVGERSDGLDLYNDPYPVGTTVITWTATDDSDRHVACTESITINTNGSDNTPPTITAPPNVSATTNSCGQIIGESELGTPDASDNCSTPNVQRTGVPPGNFFPTGTTTITYTATDGAGNTATATQTVTVTEDPAIPPTITAPNDLTVNTGSGATSCGVHVGDATLGNASANDNCPGVVVTRTGVPAGNDFPVGTTTITYTATDRSGNTATDTQTVTVIDNTAPVVTPPANVTANTGPGATSCGTVVSNATLGTATATDNCPGVGAITRTGVPAGNSFPVGTTTVTYSVTDANGNSASATQTVTVIDNTVPVITPPANVTAFTGAGATSCGTVVSDATIGTATATDNCPGVGSISRTGVPSGNVFPVGTTTINYSVTDAHGNVGTATQTVTVIDNTPPVISCPASIIADYDAAVNGAVVTYTTPVGTDNCPSTTQQTTGLASGSTFPAGITTNTFVVTDASGNTASCSFTVTVAITSIVGLDGDTLSGNVIVDSYNSSIGYPASKGSLANLFSNGTVSISGSAKEFGNVRSTRVGVSVQGTAQVNGNATAGTTVSKGSSAVITGTITNNALAPVMTLPSVVACSPFSSNSGISGTYSYNSSTGDLTLSGTNLATLANGTYCFHNVSLSNSGQLKVNGPVTIKLTGTLTTGGASSLNNTTQIPSNLRVLSSFGGANGVTFGNSAAVYLLVYAPTTPVANTGSAPLYGTVVGKTITVSNSGMIHYDTQLKSLWPQLWPLILGP